MGKIPVVSIDTGIPVPDSVSYPFEHLEVGDSFLVPIDKRASVASLATKYGQKTNTEFAVRKVSEDNVRVWRTK